MKLNFFGWAYLLTPGLKQLAADNGLSYVPPTDRSWCHIQRLAMANRYSEIWQEYLQALAIHSCDYEGFPVSSSLLRLENE